MNEKGVRMNEKGAQRKEKGARKRGFWSVGVGVEMGCFEADLRGNWGENFPSLGHKNCFGRMTKSDKRDK